MTLYRSNTLTVTTPEGVVFSLPIAGPVTRFLAWSFDWFCIMAAMSVLGPVAALFQIVSIDLYQGVMALTYFFLSFAYAILTEWFMNGQTFGKRVFGLRVVDIQGLRLTFSQITLRNLLRAVDGLPALYMVGGIVSLFSEQGQRIGDLAANTVVIRSLKVWQPELREILPDKYNSFLAYPHLCARLRQTVSQDLAGIAVRALFRRSTLEAGARVKLFSEIAERFRGLVEFPGEAMEGLSDEQVVRNCVEILFKS